MNFNESEVLANLRSDFSALMATKQRGDTIEVSTPFVMPNSHDFVRVFITKRDNRWIATDGGDIDEVSDFSTADKLRGCWMVKYHEGYFYKDCEDPALLSAIVFDVAHFIWTAATVKN